MPLRMAPIACSRMPKWRLRPAYSPAWKSPAPSKVSRVLVDGARSAAPPISQGTFWAIALRTRPDEIRVAIPLLSVGKGRQVRVPAVGELTMLHPVELVGQFGMLGPVPLNPAEPGVAQRLAAPADALAEVLVDSVGHEELRVLGPAVIALGQPDFLLAQGLAVGGAGVLLVGRAPADVAVDDDQGRPIALLEEDAEGAVEQVEVVGVADPGDVPAVAQEPGGDVLAERQRGVPLDRDVVVVVDPAEVGELPVARRARRPRRRCPPSCSRRRRGRRR